MNPPFENRRYGIASKTDLDREIVAGNVDPHTLFDLVVQTSPDTLRLSLDGEWVVLKADGVEPVDSLGGLTRYAYLVATADALGIRYTEYSLEDLREVLDDPDWSEE